MFGEVYYRSSRPGEAAFWLTKDASAMRITRVNRVEVLGVLFLWL